LGPVNRKDWGKFISPSVDKQTPFYRWYLYKHGYSKRLVEQIIAKFKLKAGQSVLDPFCGGGTTLLAAAENGLNAVGFDIMSFPVLVSNTKMLRPSVSNVEKYEKKFTLEKIRVTKPYSLPDIKIFEKAFNKKTLNFLLKFRGKIDDIKKPALKNIFLLCYLKTLEKAGRARKSGGFLRLTKARNASQKKIFTQFTKFLDEVKTDLKAASKLKGKAQAKVGDSRKISSKQKFDAVISSPPYPNRHDYTRVYLLEEALGFNKNDKEIKWLRYKTLRSHVEAKKQKFDATGYVRPAKLTRAIKKLEKKDLNNPKIVEMIDGFFEDMYLTLKNVKGCVKAGGKVGFVISNARYAGVPVLTDEILRDVGKQAGLATKEIILLRNRGNSSQQMKEYNRLPARESLVIFEKSLG